MTSESLGRSFDLFILGEWRGTYTPPFLTSNPEHLNIYCTICGEVFVKRISASPKAYFRYDSGICPTCYKKDPDRYYDPWWRLNLISTEERLKSWEPIELLTELLSLSLEYLYDERSCEPIKPITYPSHTESLTWLLSAANPANNPSITIDWDAARQALYNATGIGCLSAENPGFTSPRYLSPINNPCPQDPDHRGQRDREDQVPINPD